MNEEMNFNDMMGERQMRLLDHERLARQVNAVLVLLQDYNCCKEKEGHDGLINCSLQASMRLSGQLYHQIENDLRTQLTKSIFVVAPK